MLPLIRALEETLALASPLPPESVPLGASIGRVLAEAVAVRVPIPPFDHAAMDGYAVRAESIRDGTSLPVAFEVRAGRGDPPPLPDGQAARIFTGAPMPPGADGVVMQERTEHEGHRVRILETPRSGQHVRRRGEEVDVGSPLLTPGHPLGPGDVALLASQGLASVSVRRRPRVAILTSGDELRPPETPLSPGTLYDSNGPMLEAAVREAGGIPRRLPPAADHPEAVANALGAALREADLVVSAGGVSVGDHDHMLEAWERLGIECRFWKVAIKPGKPLALGRAPNGTPLLALPGNPVSAWVTFELFARPMLRAMSGDAEPFRVVRMVRTARPLSHRPGRTEAVRARRDPSDPERAVPFPRQSSGALPSLASVDWLLLLPAQASSLPEGARLPALDLHTQRGGGRLYGAPDPREAP